MDKEVVAAGKRIFYRTYGSGKKMMLIHGFPETGEVWRNQVDYLKDKFLLIIPDLPGSGQSEMIPDMSMEGMADVLKAILDNEDPASGKAALIGHSMGGYIALAFAEKYPGYLSGFGLFHSTAYADNDEKKATRKKGIDFIRQHGVPEFVRTLVPKMFASASADATGDKEASPDKAEDQRLVDKLLAEANNFSAQSLVSYYEAMMKRPDRTAVLQKASVPVLFIMGEKDIIIPLSDGLKLCSLPEISYIHVLRKSGHMGMWEEADYTNDILEQYVNGT